MLHAIRVDHSRHLDPNLAQKIHLFKFNRSAFHSRQNANQINALLNQVYTFAHVSRAIDMALGLGNRIGGDACYHFEEGGGLFVEDGEFGEEFAVEAFDGVDGEIGVAAAEVGEDAVCVLGVDFGEEVFSSGDFGVRVYVGGMMIAPACQNDVSVDKEYRLGFVPTSLANSSVWQARKVTKPLMP